VNPPKAKSGKWRKGRERARKGLAILPSLLTISNAICGIAAIVKIAKIQWFMPAADAVAQGVDWASNFRDAAMLILLGMVFDVLDGRVARLTRTTSDFGGQLDSLSDAITFGVAPGLLAIMANAEARFPMHPFWTKVAWVFGIAYSCGAVTRLARFNVQNDHDEKAHLEFTGLPSPGAAGVMATLVLLQSYLLGRGNRNVTNFVDATLVEKVGQGITFVLPFAALACGYLMVSKFKYVHAANKYLKGRAPFYYVRLAFLPIVLFALLPEVMAWVVFTFYAATGPIMALRAKPATDALPAPAPGGDGTAPQPAAPPPAPSVGMGQA
jgi:CDP-diacylglycerol--serine O-phosphatidyltransferase